MSILLFIQKLLIILCSSKILRIAITIFKATSRHITLSRVTQIKRIMSRKRR